MPVVQRLSWGLCWIFLGSLTIAADDDVKKLVTKRIEFKVRVVEPSGKPIAGAAIQVWKRHDVKRITGIPARGDLVPIGEATTIRTDADGKAEFSVSLQVMPATFHMWRNSIHLVAVEESHLVCRSPAIDSANVDHMEATVTLRRLLSIAGRVIDEQGRPVADATVFHTGNAVARVETKTDPEGRFTLPGVPEGKTPVFVQHPKFHFHGQLIDTASAALECKLLSIDQTPPPKTTLPPVLSRQEELTLARQIIAPLWEEALKTKEEKTKDRAWKIEQIANFYVKLEPWLAYRQAEGLLSKADASRFFWRHLPYLYPNDPEESLAMLESLDTFPSTKTYALVRTAKEAQGISAAQKLEVLDRAVMIARTISEPNLRVEELSSIARALYDLGKIEEAKQIVEEIQPLAATLSTNKDAYAVAWAGVAVSLFDLPAGLRLTRSVENDTCRPDALFEIAKRIAAQNPAEAERIATEAIEHQLAQAEKEYRQAGKGEWPEEEKFSMLDEYNYRFTPICYRMAAVDPTRAKRLALTLQSPSYRALCVGVIAEAVAKTDKTQARRLILEAYEILAKSIDNPRRTWWCFYSPPKIGGMLLPIVEEIDPALVEECLWQAVSFRHWRPSADFILGQEPEWDDSRLAVFLARYDRALATAIFPPENFVSEPLANIPWSTQEIFVFTDPPRIPALVGKNSLNHFYFVQKAVETLLLEPSRRWDELAIPYKN